MTSPNILPGVTQQQFAKQPVYIREAIEKLIRERDRAVEDARRVKDTQTVTDCWVEDYGAEPGRRREYVQGDSVVFVKGGVCLKVCLHRKDAIELSWSEGDAPYGTGEVAFIPTSHQQARLVAADKMYTWGNEEQRAKLRAKRKAAAK